MSGRAGFNFLPGTRGSAAERCRSGANVRYEGGRQGAPRVLTMEILLRGAGPGARLVRRGRPGRSRSLFADALFNSQTRKAARSRLFVRVSVPTAGRGASVSPVLADFGLRLVFFCDFFFGRRRTVASLTFKSPPVVIGPISSYCSEIAASLPRGFRWLILDAFDRRKALVPPPFFGDFIRSWPEIGNWVV